jgi:hypothetical protein
MPASLRLTCENPRLKASLIAHFSRVGDRMITQISGTFAPSTAVGVE